MPHQSSDISNTIWKNETKQDGKLYDENRKAYASKRVLVLEDAHARHVAESKSLSHGFVLKGIGGC